MNSWDTNLSEGSGEGEANDRYLIFKMGGDLYAVPLLEILEVIEPMPAQSIPNTQPHFTGLINVRGRIYFVVDFRIKFNLKTASQEGKPAFLLYQEGTSFFAMAVDVVTSVMKIPNEDIDINSNIVNNKNLGFIRGIAKATHKIISVLNMKELFKDEIFTNDQNLEFLVPKQSAA